MRGKAASARGSRRTGRRSLGRSRHAASRLPLLAGRRRPELGALIGRAILRLGADLGHARGGRGLLALQAACGTRARSDPAIREPLRFPAPGAALSARRARRSGQRAIHARGDPRGAAGDRGQWRARLSALHESPRIARRRARAAATTRQRSAGARPRAGRGCARPASAHASAMRATRCCLARAVSGKASTSGATRFAW